MPTLQRSSALPLFYCYLLVTLLASCGQSLLNEDDFLYANVDALAAGDSVVDAAVDAVADVAPDVMGDTQADTGDKPECTVDDDCLGIKGKTPCRLPHCNKGKCELKQLAADAPCVHPLRTLAECEQTRCDAKGDCAVVASAEATSCGIGACGKLCKAGACVIAEPSDYDDNNHCTKDFCKQGA